MFRPQMPLSALNTSAINDSFYSILAEAICMLHNHPSGNPEPSKADIVVTREIVDAAKLFNIKVHDHLIVGRDGATSFRTLGLIP